MNVKLFLALVTALLVLAVGSGASAQTRGTGLIPPPGSPFLGGIPDPSPTNQPLTLFVRF